MDDQANNSIKYHNISLLVRPARVAILIPDNDEYWKYIIIQIFEWCSRIWGGAYFLIVPTNGNEIIEPFWRILDEYSPDFVYSFSPTIQDLKLADPNKYESIITRYKNAFIKQFPDMNEENFEQFVERDIKIQRRYEYKTDEHLQQKIKQLLTPFYFNEYIVEENISTDASVPFPLTRIENIVQQGGVEKLYVVDNIEDIDCSLTFYSNWGLYSTGFEKILTEKKVKINHIPKDVLINDLLKFSIQKRVDLTEIKYRRQYQDKLEKNNTKWYPDEDIFRFSPYETSLLKVSKYRTNETYIGREPITLIIGDSVKDYCLYYCLSRFQEAVYWIPEVKSIPKSRTKSEPDARTILFMTTVHAVYEQIVVGQHNKAVHLSSLSLSQEELEEVKKYLKTPFAPLSEDFKIQIEIESSPWLLQKSTYHLIEQNNYTSQDTIVFQDNKSIGRMPTPRPKNFGQVIPYDHRWITEFNIEGYKPPQLHFLGKEIIDLRGSTNETRVAKTGMCYTCPNIAYFGGDIDVTLVRPHINIIEPFMIFQEYFNEAGFTDIRLSDKGGFTQQTINKFGSLDEIGDFLKEKRGRNLLSTFREKKRSKNDTGEVVCPNDRAYLDIQKIQNLYGSNEQTLELIDTFIRKGILYRGTILYCSYCRGADWYNIGELDQAFICHRCSQRQIIQQLHWKEGKELTWFYKLDEVIYQGIANNMDLPLLTMAYLKKKAKSSFLYVPELEFRRRENQSKPELEVDICCIQDGRIILGECKKTKIAKNLIDKLNKFANTLLKPPDQLIIATLYPDVSEDIISYAKSTLPFPYSILKEDDLISIK